jgi:hypothetical protein
MMMLTYGNVLNYFNYTRVRPHTSVVMIVLSVNVQLMKHG